MEWEVLEVWVEICRQGKAEEGVERKTDPPGWKLKDDRSGGGGLEGGGKTDQCLRHRTAGR